MSYCPECESEIDAEVEEVGEIVPCPECGIDLEVTSLEPVEFDLAMDEEEEDDDDEEDYRFDDEDDDEEDWEDDYEDDEDEDEEY